MLDTLINFAKSTGIYDFVEDPVLMCKTLIMYLIIGVLIYLAIGKKYAAATAPHCFRHAAR